MKLIANDSLQGLEIYLNTPKGFKSIWLVPGETYVIPEGYITKQIKNLQHRKMVRVTDYK